VNLKERVSSLYKSGEKKRKNIYIITEKGRFLLENLPNGYKVGT